MTDAPRRTGSYHRIFVQDIGALRQAVEVLRDSDAIGVDLEMGQRVERRVGGYQEWKHILALIQIASDDVSVVIDPLRCADLSTLAPLMASSVRKVFLGGGQDVSLLAHAAIPARTIVDVGEVALGIWGRREDGMAALARRMFGISLDKTVRRADWLARPLNPALLTYAYQDAELTLRIYRWLQEHYPRELAVHLRAELDPPLPPDTPPWLVDVMQRPPSDAALALAEAGLQSDRDAERLTFDIRTLLECELSPRQLGRLIRIIGELELRDLTPEVTSHSSSMTSVVRAAAVRALGLIGESDSDREVVEALRRDRVEDVRKAADAAFKELRRPQSAAPGKPDDDEPSISIDDDTRSALQALMQQLEGDEG